MLGFISQDELLTDSRHIAYLLARLDRYIKARKCDYVAARRVVNRQDRAQLIADYVGRFERLLAGMDGVPPAKT